MGYVAVELGDVMAEARKMRWAKYQQAADHSSRLGERALIDPVLVADPRRRDRGALRPNRDMNCKSVLRFPTATTEMFNICILRASTPFRFSARVVNSATPASVSVARSRTKTTCGRLSRRAVYG